MKALPIFILDYLVYYPGQEEEYLEKVQKHFSYPVQIEEVQNLALESEQIGRLRLDHSVILYRDSASVRGTTISIVSPPLRMACLYRCSVNCVRSITV